MELAQDCVQWYVIVLVALKLQVLLAECVLIFFERIHNEEINCPFHCQIYLLPFTLFLAALASEMCTEQLFAVSSCIKLPIAT
jgi:hypothetical protein